MKKYIIILTAFLLIGSAAQGQTLSLTLEEALKIAGKNNRSLIIQRLEQSLVEEKTKEASGYFMPTISANANYSYYFDRQVIFMPGAFTGEAQQPVVDVAVGGRNAFGASLGLYQPILSPSLKNRYNSSKISQAMQETITADNESMLKLEVSSNYYQLLYNASVIKVYEQSLEHNLKALDDSKMLLKQGKSLSIDTLQNYIRAENVKAHLTNLQSQQNVLMLKLKNNLGLESSTEVLLADSLALDNVKSFLVEGNASISSIESRPDIRLNQLNVELSQTNIKAAQSQRIPTLAAVAQYGVQMQADDLINDSYNWPKTSFAGLQLNIPVFSGNRVNSQVKQSKILAEQSKIQLEDSRENASTEIKSIQSELNDAVRKLSLNKRIVESAMQSYNIISNRYGQGLNSRLELTDAELSYNQARLNYLQTVFDIKMISLLLERATGNFATYND